MVEELKRYGTQLEEAGQTVNIDNINEFGDSAPEPGLLSSTPNQTEKAQGNDSNLKGKKRRMQHKSATKK